MGAIAEGIAAYMQPLIDQTDGSHEQMQKALAVGQICYNLALLPDDKRDAAINEMRPTLGMGDEEFEAFQRSIIIPMIQRHEDMFPFLHRRGSIDAWQDGPAPREEPRIATLAKADPGIDRYAPCPCNSGEKYKFCCGKKAR